MTGRRRWYASDKAALIQRVRRNPSLKRAILAGNEISLEEYASWERALDADGVDALKITKLQTFRTDRVIGIKGKPKPRRQ